MPDTERGGLSAIVKAITDNLSKIFVGSAIAFAWTVVTSVWVYIRGELPLSVIVMLALPSFLLSTYSFVAVWLICAELTSKRARLRIHYDHRKHYTVDPKGFAVSRLLVVNSNRRNAAKNLVVQIESLDDLTSDVAHLQASSFINVLMQLERPDASADGILLKASRSVEVFGPKAPKDSDQFFFPSPEPHAGDLGSFFSGATVYCMTVFAAADNADPAYLRLLLFQQDGVLRVLKYSKRMARRALRQHIAQSAARPPIPTAAFAGHWRILPEGSEREFTIVLSVTGDAIRIQNQSRTLGRWEVVGENAQITWDDKKRKDILRPIGDRFRKLAFADGKGWDDQPTNQQWAERIPD